MSDGLVQFLHRKDAPDAMNNETDRYFEFHLLLELLTLLNHQHKIGSIEC